MRAVVCGLFVSVAIFVEFGCGGKQGGSPGAAVNDSSPNVAYTSPSPLSNISKTEAVTIAKNDFLKIRGTLRDFLVEESERENEWRIVIRLKDKYLVGVGAVYLIDKKTGKILEREISQ